MRLETPHEIEYIATCYTEDLDGLKHLQDSRPSETEEVQLDTFIDNYLYKKEMVNLDLGFWYCLEWGDKYLKIGSTKNPYDRYMSLRRTAKYGNVKLGEFYVSEPHTNYRQNEKELHDCFANKRVEGTELFEITVKEFAKEAFYLSEEINPLPDEPEFLKLLKGLIMNGLNIINGNQSE